jgi:hypothetical protein
MAVRAEDNAYQVVIDAPGDSGLHMSEEGASTTHSRGIAMSPGFLARMQQPAVAELQSRQPGILTELAALGVGTEPYPDFLCSRRIDLAGKAIGEFD